MCKLKVFGFTALAIGLLCFVPSASAQISINFGVEPVCPYGF